MDFDTNRAWDDSLSGETKRTILAVSERLVAAAYQNDAALDLRPPRQVDESESDLRGRHVGEFSNEQIRMHVRHARETIFSAFDSERAANATYPDSRFTELQALMALGGCGTPQGQSRMETFFGEDYTPHGDTHLRTIKQYTPETIQAGFDRSIEYLLNAVNHLQILQPPVTVAIDITTWPYHAEDELPREVSGTDDSGERAYKFATLSLVGKSLPIVLAVEPVIVVPNHFFENTDAILMINAVRFIEKWVEIIFLSSSIDTVKDSDFVFPRRRNSNSNCDITDGTRINSDRSLIS